MNAAKYTPGPWYVLDNGHCVGGPASDGAEVILHAGVAMCGMARRSKEEAAANARLIAQTINLLGYVTYHAESGDSDAQRLVLAATGQAVPRVTLTSDSAVRLVQAELERARLKFPTWPTDPLHALAVLGEEFGELTKDMLQLIYEPHKTSRERVRTEAIQTAAMALRLVMSLERYEYTPSTQHVQDGDEA